MAHLCFLTRHFDKQNFNYREGYTSAPTICALCIHIVCGAIDRGGILSLLELVANMLSGGRAAVGLASSAGQRPKLFLPAPKSGHSGLSGRPVPASRCCHFLVQWPLDRGLPMASASTQTQPPLLHLRPALSPFMDILFCTFFSLSLHLSGFNIYINHYNISGFEDKMSWKYFHIGGQLV